jgi:hypothetical protein
MQIQQNSTFKIQQKNKNIVVILHYGKNKKMKTLPTNLRRVFEVFRKNIDNRL